MSASSDGGPVEVPLLRGGVTLVSSEDAERVLAYTWRETANGYVVRRQRGEGGRTLLLHRFISDAPEGLEDHLDEDRKNNVRANLTLVSPSEHQGHHREQTVANNRARRIYSLTGTCRRCGLGFTSNPNHRGRQVCCSKRCAILLATEVRVQSRKVR